MQYFRTICVMLSVIFQLNIQSRKKHPAHVDIVVDAFQVKILQSNQEDISTPITQNDTCI